MFVSFFLLAPVTPAAVATIAPTAAATTKAVTVAPTVTQGELIMHIMTFFLVYFGIERVMKG